MNNNFMNDLNHELYDSLKEIDNNVLVRNVKSPKFYYFCETKKNIISVTPSNNDTLNILVWTIKGDYVGHSVLKPLEKAEPYNYVKSTFGKRVNELTLKATIQRLYE